MSWAWALAWLLVGCAVKTGLDVPPPSAGEFDPELPLDPVITPPPPIADPAVDLSAGLFHSCAVRASGDVVCWGFNNFGQLGDGTTVGRAEASPVVGLPPSQAVSAGREHTCALTIGGRVLCWGANRRGELGGAVVALLSSTPVEVPLGGRTTQVAAGGQHTCAVTEGGDAVCWGDDSEGQLGGRRAATHFEALVRPDIGPVRGLSAGWRHTCAIRSDATVACWGWNADGQATGTATTDTARPAALELEAEQVSAGDHHSCAVSAGAVSCWGRNDHGQLGRLPSLDTGVRSVTGLDDVLAVSAGHEHTCALRASGEVACWGRADRGQLGDGGDPADHVVPVAAHGLFAVEEIDMGWRHGCARTGGGDVLCWGRGVEGQTGDTQFGQRLPPMPVAGFAD